MKTLWQDLRCGARTLAKNPGFSVVAVIALALGLGANTAIFSVFNAVLLRPLPYPEADRLMVVYETNLARGQTDVGASMPDFREWRGRNQSFERMAAFSTDSYNISSNEEPERVVGAQASIDLVPLLGVEPSQGRAFLPEEEIYGKHRVVIVSEELWRSRFGADAKLLNQTIKLNGEDFNVVGVMPRGFDFPERRVMLWTPLALPDGSSRNTRGNYWLGVVGRLKPGVTEAQAQADLNNVHHQLAQDVKETAGYGARVESLHEATVGNVRAALVVLLAAVACVMLIACANVANLLLARAAGRQREVAIRAALGANRRRLIRQLMTESLLLSILGGIAGLLLAVWGVDALVSLEPDLPRLNAIRVDGRALVFMFALVLLTSLLFGIAPAWRATKINLDESLKEGGRRATGGGREYRLLNSLVVAEIAIALVLLVGAGLMVNSLLRLQHVDPGFKTNNILTMQLALPKSRYPDERRELTVGFYRQLLERLKALPGVEAAGMTTALPLTQSGWGKVFTREDRPAPKSLKEIPSIQYRQVSAGYFNTLGIPLTKGRFLSESDTSESSPVAVINETMAKRFWPDEDPLGKRFWLGPPEEMVPPGILRPNYRFIRWTIVGVVGDVKHQGLSRSANPEAYTLPEQSLTNDSPARTMYVAVRTAGDPTSLTAAIRRQVQELDTEQPVAEVATMERRLSESLAQSRFNTSLLTIFAAVACRRAALGVYGVMSYSVSQRTHEIGIRMALGAQSSDVLHIIVRRGMMLALFGVGIGMAGALALTRLMKNLLYGVSATDPFTFAAIALLLAGTAFLACYIPARRAAKVDPMVALRYE
ncbi:ABC transporter permease [soil metagenome]